MQIRANPQEASRFTLQGEAFSSLSENNTSSPVPDNVRDRGIAAETSITRRSAKYIRNNNASAIDTEVR